MSYEVRAVKGFMGEDCPGYNATLFRDGKKVAFVICHGNGGEDTVEWEDAGKVKMVDGKIVTVGAAPRVEVPTTDYKGEPMTMRCTPEEAMLLEFLKGKTMDCGEGLGTLEMTIPLFVSSLVDDYENAKRTQARIKRACKAKTLFRVKGDKNGLYREVSMPFSKRVKDFIVGKYGDQVEVIENERLGQVAV